MTRNAALIAVLVAGTLLSVTGCDDWPRTPKVILIRHGEMEISGVYKYSNHCWVAWYHGIEHIILKRDGTANDTPFRYEWEPLDLAARDKGTAAFFDSLGCKEP